MTTATYIRGILSCMALFICCSLNLQAQKEAKVHGTAKMVVSEHDNISLPEAKQKCILRARYNAIKEAFGEIISSTTNMAEGELNGEEINNFVEETTMNAKAEWVEDSKEPVFDIKYSEDCLVITAEVWGVAREIVQAKVDFTWHVLCDGTENYFESDKFQDKQRVFVSFRSPVKGYVAIYLLDSTNKEANCLLPYKTNPDGFHEVKAGRDYVFFDRDTDPQAIPYRLTTNKPMEMNQVVLIFSPNKFTKCNENRGDRLHPNSLSIDNFEKWVRGMTHRDAEMVVDRSKYLTIMGKDS
ncbi:MAG: DUF4384 domain-containing protein [Bacteroidales bacterium]|nr:DUF4384 domain-containing protein [Bacteroidales bacterium]